MKIHYMSDLHLEINKSVPTWITGSIDEVLVIAGDTTMAALLVDEVKTEYAIQQRQLFTDLVEQTKSFYKVVFVMGNHEHYHGNITQSKQFIQHFLYNVLGVSPEQYVVLENDHIGLGDDTILFGATLWTDMGKNNPVSHFNVLTGMADYRWTADIEDDEIVPLCTEATVKRHHATVDFIRQLARYNESKRIIVATHHAPHYKSNGSEHVNSAITDGYCSDLSDLILDNPNITNWICGHTHSDVEYEIGTCKIHTFQRGYLKHGEGKNFTEEVFQSRFIVL